MTAPFIILALSNMAGYRQRKGQRVTGFTVSAGYANGVLNYAAARGAERSMLLKAAQIEAEEFHNPDNRIDIANYQLLIGGGETGLQCACLRARVLQ